MFSIPQYQMPCYYSVVVNYNHFLKIFLSDVFYNDINMLSSMVEYLESDDCEFFFNINFDDAIIACVDDINSILRNNVDDDISIKINVKYIT